MTLLPTPLRLKSSFVWKTRLGGIVLILVGLAAAAGFARWQYDSVKELVDQSRIWKAGVPAFQTSAKGQVTTNHGIFHEYDLEVSFVDGNQVAHQDKLEFDTLFGEVDQASDPMVRYLENDPEHFALSWAMDVVTSRWAAIVFMAVVGIGLVGGSFTYLGGMALRRLSDARGCALRSNEVVVRITKVVATKASTRHVGNEYHFTGRMVDGREVSGKRVFPIKYEPLFADGGKQTMLVLIPQENVKRPVVLRGDFHPFELTPDEQSKVRQSMASRSATAG
jgi:hypothetical protein